MAGRPGLSPRDQQKLLLGNALFDIAVDFFELCKDMRIPFIWENPFTSFMWKMKRSIAVLRWPHVQDVEVHYCGYEQAWKKPTRFRCFMVPGAKTLLERLCRSNPCQFTGLPHIRLQGTDAHGVFWTLRACAYPWPLCDQLATALINAARSKNFAERAGEFDVELGLKRNASVKRKLEDESSSTASFLSVCSIESLLQGLEGQQPGKNFCAVDSSCVDLPFQKLGTKDSSNSTREECVQDMSTNMYVDNIAVRDVKCDVGFDINDQDNDDDKSFCSCFSFAG